MSRPHACLDCLVILFNSIHTNNFLFLSRRNQMLQSAWQPSSSQSPLSSIKARLNRLQALIVHGQESRRAMDNMSKLNRSRLDTSVCTRWSGSSQLPQPKPCRGQQVLEQSYAANQHGTWISCTTCALRLHHVPRHSARMTSVSTLSSASVQEALLKRMSLLRDNDFTAKTNDLRSRGTEASKEEGSTTNDDSVQHREQLIQEQHPVRRSAPGRQCTEKSRHHHHHLESLQCLVGGPSGREG